MSAFDSMALAREQAETIARLAGEVRALREERDEARALVDRGAALASKAADTVAVLRATVARVELLPEQIRAELLRLLTPMANPSTSHIIGCVQELVFRALRGEP